MIDRDRNQCERILTKIEFIEKTTHGMNQSDFMGYDVVQHAVCMSLITIGECANHLSEKFIDRHPEIEWIQIVAVRNIAAHGYWQLNINQIWQAVNADIPNLKEFMLKKL